MTKFVGEMPRTDITQVGCFKIGSKVVRGNGKLVMMITEFQQFKGRNVCAKLNNGGFYNIKNLSLAGPNGDGMGT